MLSRSLLVLALLGGSISLTAACASSSDEGSGRTIEVKAEQLRFAPAEISVSAGERVTLRLKNVDVTAHDLEIQGLRAQIISGGGHGGHRGTMMMPDAVAVHTESGRSATVTFVAQEKGTYEIWCTISGHKELGMVAKLVVT